MFNFAHLNKVKIFAFLFFLNSLVYAQQIELKETVKVYTVRLQDAMPLLSGNKNLYKIHSLEKKATKIESYVKKDNNATAILEKNNIILVIQNNDNSKQNYNDLLELVKRYYKQVNNNIKEQKRVRTIIDTMLKEE